MSDRESDDTRFRNFCDGLMKNAPQESYDPLSPRALDAMRMASETPHFDSVHKQIHYNTNPSGIERIRLAKHMNFCLGSAMKYIFRADLKNGVEDLRKAVWYIEAEIALREKKENVANESPAGRTEHTEVVSEALEAELRDANFFLGQALEATECTYSKMSLFIILTDPQRLEREPIEDLPTIQMAARRIQKEILDDLFKIMSELRIGP